jgi:catechol 2,3-dioxygenase-like lactoylglutathione lyase family enzyme
MAIPINGLQHVGIPVTAVEVSESFYERLGFECVMRSAFIHNGAEGKVSMMRRNGIIIELYQMPEAELPEIKKRMDGRIDHIAFDVTQIDEVFMAVRESGFETLQDSPVYLPFWKNGCRYFYISGPDGERLEFCEIL